MPDFRISPGRGDDELLAFAVELEEQDVIDPEKLAEPSQPDLERAVHRVTRQVHERRGEVREYLFEA